MSGKSEAGCWGDPLIFWKSFRREPDDEGEDESPRVRENCKTLALLGTLLAMTVIAPIAWIYKRDFAREFGDSLRLERAAPFGEDAIAQIQMDPRGR